MCFFTGDSTESLLYDIFRLNVLHKGYCVFQLMHFQLSASTHQKSEPWSPLSFAVDRLTISKSDEVKTKPDANDSIQRKHPRMTSTYSPPVSEQQQQSSFRLGERPNELSRSELDYRLAYFLVRDLQPPEVLNETGFKVTWLKKLPHSLYLSSFSILSNP
ncbi:hypothetical protein T265_00201 [Opisthorchis viverrini]|uniref:Uncharacterized protein n=1 Tax=Opisthorchis viverrini TaxID=6198 RepID=A0A075A3Q6_OPIVI|nr:hypothetical protein T265_00201 [Opisthorchis viverrini]KER34006.1 hypothetical protein T265_00201 [Opisthorchis viverrini]